MNVIDVKTSPRKTMRCVVSGRGVCRYCYALIVWATTPSGKAIPLQPWTGDAREAEAHFTYCQRQPSEVAKATEKVISVPMTLSLWRQLMQLIHPDRHHGTENELLANEATRWLLQQRERLKG